MLSFCESDVDVNFPYIWFWMIWSCTAITVKSSNWFVNILEQSQLLTNWLRSIDWPIDLIQVRANCWTINLFHHKQEKELCTSSLHTGMRHCILKWNVSMLLENGFYQQLLFCVTFKVISVGRVHHGPMPVEA